MVIILPRTNIVGASLCLWALILMWIPAASASTVVWTVDGTFSDGGTLRGTFDFDADSSTVSNWALVASGSSPSMPHPFFPFNYDPANSTFSSESCCNGHLLFVFNATKTIRVLEFAFNPDITSAGGWSHLMVSPGVTVEISDPFHSEFVLSRDISAGIVRSVPEPGQFVLISMGLVFIALQLRRRHSGARSKAWSV